MGYAGHQPKEDDMNKSTHRTQPGPLLGMPWMVIEREPRVPRLHMIVLGVAIGVLVLGAFV